MAGTGGRRPPRGGRSDEDTLRNSQAERADGRSPTERGGTAPPARDPRTDDADSTLPTQRPLAAAPARLIDDDRPTQIFQPAAKRSLHTSREQLITGSTILEMIRNPSHALSRALEQLVARAQSDLPTAEVDPKATLLLCHDFEFEQRVGYRLRLKLFAPDNQCVEVNAEVDADGRAIRRGSMMSKLITI